MKLPPKRYLIIAGFLLSLLSLLYILSVTHQSPNSASPTSKTTPSVPLQVKSVFPSAGKHAFPSSTTGLSITFNKPTSISQVRVEITPHVETQSGFTAQDPTTFYVRPVKPWVYHQTYNVKVVGPLGVVLYEYQLTFIPLSETKDYYDDSNSNSGGL